MLRFDGNLPPPLLLSTSEVSLMRTLIHTSAVLLLALVSLAAGAAAQEGNAQGDGVRRVTPAEVRAALEKGEAVIVDVRGSGAYEAGHIKGARSMPTDQLLSRIGELPRDKMVITYCS
jgi:predicted sulfurtransferase